MFKAAPLPHEWMIASVIGFFVSLLEVYPNWSIKWGIAFMIFFGIMFIASMISVTMATTEPDHISALAAHHKHSPVYTLKDRIEAKKKKEL